MNITDLIPSVFPSRYALARALGIRPSAVYAWPNGELPPLRVYQIKEITQIAPQASAAAPSGDDHG
jgi:hypothetical protein